MAKPDTKSNKDLTKMALRASHARLWEVLEFAPGLKRSILASKMAADLVDGRCVVIVCHSCGCGNPDCVNNYYDIGPIVPEKK